MRITIRLGGCQLLIGGLVEVGTGQSCRQGICPTCLSEGATFSILP